MRRYETLFVLQPELPEAQVRETLDRVRRLIEGMGGQVAEIQDWGIRELAYPIRKQSRGTYILTQYTASPAIVTELERTLKLADEVLRFISVRLPEARRTARLGAAQLRSSTTSEHGLAAGVEEGD
jgi:small subunit ribosomal protein S6